MARRPLERERVCLDGGRRTTQLMRDSLGSADELTMKQVLSTHDRSLAESLRIALEAEGIETAAEADHSLVVHAPAIVSVARDEDYQHALQVLHSISGHSRLSGPPPWFRWPVRLVL